MKEAVTKAFSLLVAHIRSAPRSAAKTRAERLLDAASRSLGRGDAASVAVAKVELNRTLTSVSRSGLLSPEQIAEVNGAFSLGRDLAAAYHNYLLITAPANCLPI